MQSAIRVISLNAFAASIWTISALCFSPESRSFNHGGFSDFEDATISSEVMALASNLHASAVIISLRGAYKTSCDT